MQVAAFNIVNACQEYLQTHNAAPEAEMPKPSSLWHEMQQVHTFQLTWHRIQIQMHEVHS